MGKNSFAFRESQLWCVMSEVKTGTSMNLRSQWGEVLAERSRTSAIRSMTL